MPNWCVNKVTVTGNDLDKFMAYVNNDCENLFESFTGRPSELDQWEQINGQYFKTITFDEGLTSEFNVDKVPVPEDEVKAFTDKWGCEPSWHDWNVKYYGTKWDVGKNELIINQDEECVQLQFNTAWSPPDSFFFAIARGLDVTFDHVFCEGGMGMLGRTIFKKDEVDDVVWFQNIYQHHNEEWDAMEEEVKEDLWEKAWNDDIGS